jgi:hypothetical protein
MVLVSELDLPTYDGPLRPARTSTGPAASWRRELIAARRSGLRRARPRRPATQLLRDRLMAFPAIELLVMQGVTVRTASGTATQDRLMARSGEPPRPAAADARPAGAFTPARPPSGCGPSCGADRGPVGAGGAGGPLRVRVDPGRAAAVAGRSRCCSACPVTPRRWRAGACCCRRSSRCGCPRWRRRWSGLRGGPVVRRRPARATAREPGEDLASVLATAGEKISDDEAAILVSSVISGGTDTTTAQLAHGLRLFAEHPEQWRRCARTPRWWGGRSRRCCATSRSRRSPAASPARRSCCAT